MAQAQARAYEGVDAISWSGAFCRKDIGYRAIAREAQTDKINDPSAGATTIEVSGDGSTGKESA